MDPNSPQARWTEDEQGRPVMPLLQREFLEWLVTPAGVREPPTESGFALLHDVSVRSLRRYKDDPRFKEAWEERLRDTNFSPERVQNIIENLYEIAISGKTQQAVRAAEMYLQYVQRSSPKRAPLPIDSRIAAMSNDELLALAQEESEGGETD